MSDLLSLTNSPNYWSREQMVLHGKHAVPQSVWDYLACVDAKLSERGHNLPEPLPELIDRERQAALMAAQRAEIAEKEWKSRIKHWASSLPGESAGADVSPWLRLRLVDNGAIIELRKPGQLEFSKASTAQLKNLPNSGNRTAGDTILSFAKGQWGMVKNEFHKVGDDLPGLLLQFISMPQLRNALVGSDGQPVTFHEEPLVWAIDEASSHAYTLHLRDVHGATPPEPLVVVLSHPSWFVTSKEIWPLERWPFTHRDAGARMDIPASALETGEGVTVLRKLGLSLPERIQAKVRTVKATVTVRAGIDQQGEGASSYLKVTAQSDYDDGSPGELLSLSGWLSIKGEKGATPMQGIVTYERSALLRATAWLNTMDLKHQISWRNSETWWQRRITKEFPDEFLQWMAARPEDVVVELDKELASLRDGMVSASVRLDVEESEMDWFDLRVALNVTDTTLTQEEIQLLLKAQGRWVRITGKGWRKLHFEMTPEQEAELAAMGLTVADFDGAPQRLHALQLAGGAGKEKSLLPAERVEAVRRRAEEIRTRVQPVIPATITAQLRPYQLEGFHFLAYLSTNRFGGVLADDMGLGKTLQSLTWLAWLRETELNREPAGTLPPVLVVCPKSVQDNWRSETARFCPDLRVVVWSRDDAGKSGLDGEADLVVIHYQQLRQHEEALSRQRWLAVILDEAQAIKNPSSLSAKAACALQAGHRLALSGTPVENRLLDLWSILGFAMPGILGNRTHFAKHFDAKEDPLARRRLAARVRPFLLRRTKKEVAKDLPDRVEEDLVCELEGSQRTLYQAELKRARAALLNIKTTKQLDKARFNILTSLLRLRQICCHPALVLKEDVSTSKTKKRRGKASTADAATAATGSAKLDALLELLEPIMEEGGKVLVFSQFVEMLSLVRGQLEAREWPHFLLTGQTEDRGALVKQFQECSGPAIFLISLKAGGFGLNLTAASYVVLCDPWWNPAVEAQAIDRTHRIGQTQKVNAYRLIVKDSIEEKIRLLQKQKSALAQDILGEENFASALSLDDFRFLLGEG
ncbi:DEAD/DEAH box helicase [Roseimicrobium sp. ORNL1]|uniref:DEAD/DEAH box helicase n=1 Tax=Roseimicrobium sp. ORNL1 TaxID=2711231 RepID=UPI001F0F4161|nr:DEAD/DEAH box helicase [Roseimicrobium sp. ORNL1]